MGESSFFPSFSRETHRLTANCVRLSEDVFDGNPASEPSGRFRVTSRGNDQKNDRTAALFFGFGGRKSRRWFSSITHYGREPFLSPWTDRPTEPIVNEGRCCYTKASLVQVFCRKSSLFTVEDNSRSCWVEFSTRLSRQRGTKNETNSLRCPFGSSSTWSVGRSVKDAFPLVTPIQTRNSRRQSDFSLKKYSRKSIIFARQAPTLI